MHTFIELHLIAYFLFCVVILSIISKFNNTASKTYLNVVCSSIFCVVKFLMDYFHTIIYLQFIVLFFILISSIFVTFRPKHISLLKDNVFVLIASVISVLGVQYIINNLILGTNIYYISNYYLLMLIGVSLVTYFGFNIIKSYLTNKKPIILSKQCKLCISEKYIDIIGYVDTGNNLVDNITKLNVVIVNFSCIKNYLSEKMIADILLSTNSCGEFVDLRKIKYTTVGGTDYMTIFKPKSFSVDGKPINCYIGVSVKSCIVGYDALLNSACL